MAEFGPVNKIGGIIAAGVAIAGCGQHPEPLSKSSFHPDATVGVETSVKSIAEDRRAVDSDLDETIERGNLAFKLYNVIEAQPPATDGYTVKKGKIRITIPEYDDLDNPRGSLLISQDFEPVEGVRRLATERNRLMFDLEGAVGALKSAYPQLDRDQQTRAKLALGAWSTRSDNAKEAIDAIDGKDGDRIRLL